MGGSLGNLAWPMENLGRALPLPSAPAAWLPQRECVRPAQCAWRLGPSALPEAGSSQAQAAAAAASSHLRKQRRGGTGRRGTSPAPPVQPSPARPDSLPTPGQPLPPGEKVEEEIQPLARAHHHGPL